MRWILLLCFSCSLFANSFENVTPSSPEEILSLSCDLLIEGRVSVSSGQISLSETDLHIRGAQDLILKRNYIPPHILGRYRSDEKADRLELGKALQQLETKGWVVLSHLWAGTNRHSPYFQVRDPQGFVLEFEIQENVGILKFSSIGCSNLRGEKPSSAADIRNIELRVVGDWVKISWPEGIERHYLKSYANLYRLEKELLPNGKAIQYEYNGPTLTKISSCDPSGKFIYATIEKLAGNQYRGSDGTEAILTYDSREIKGKSKKGGKEKASFHFPVMTSASCPFYANAVGYNERTLLNSYDAKAYPFSCTYHQIKDVPARIKTFSTPSGSSTFYYDLPVAGKKGGTTTVLHPNGAQTVYGFNQNLLLQSIGNYFEEKLINQKIFSYDAKQHIKSIETRDGKDRLLIVKRFECDQAGNPLLEQTEGDFGCFSIRRTFSKNRILSEERDDGLRIDFTYLGDTHLLTSKTTSAFGEQLRKTTYAYDEANNLIEKAEVGKTRTRYALYQTAPHLHRIEWEEKFDWDDQLIHKVHFSYDQWGTVADEKHFSSDGEFAYAIERTYNQKGELCKETNPLGYTARYEYDSRGRCIQEVPFSNKLIINRSFDGKGRLIQLNEGDQETRYAYNASDELIEKTDYLGYTTKTQYDPIHGKPTLIEEPPSITRIEYDCFGREKMRIDATGAKTQTTHNSYGDVSKIIYPEGGEESFTYAPNGLIQSRIDPDGLKTTYTHDALGRLLTEKVGSQTTTYRYDAYNLLETIDPMGYSTTYHYDFSDRLIQEKRENRLTSYGYDLLGFLAWEERASRRIEYTNDVLGRVLLKSIDGVLKTHKTYDASGNLASLKQGGITTFKSDGHNRLVETIDPQGNKTTIQYESGPQVLLKTIIDPLGIQTVETSNPHGQILKREVAGQLVEEFSYDNAHRLSSQDHLNFAYTPNGNKSSITEANERATQWLYTPANRIAHKLKPDGITLLHEYDSQMRLIKVGDREFQYDGLNRLVGGTGFARTLDAFGNIIREEWANGLWIESIYDDWNRPISRTLPDLSRILYHYKGPFLTKVTRVLKTGEELYAHSYSLHDAKGNPKLETGLFKTAYEYDQSGRRIAQKNPYYQETTEYDPAGNLIRKGATTYSYDALSQMTSESDRFTAAYDVHYNLQNLNGNQIRTNALNQIEGYSYDQNGNLLKPGFVYDAFDQLIEAGGERNTYDALGRRLQQGATAFLYIGDEEIGSFENNKPQELKILGSLRPIAIELKEKPYVPVADIQETIRLLIDQSTGEIAFRNDCDAFGTGLTEAIPYAYAGKRFDRTTNFLYFGKRYYDPSIRRWLTPDPLGPFDHSNLYQYVLNSPFRYQDPTGEFVCMLPLVIWGASEVAIPVLSAYVMPLVYGAITGAVAYGGYQLVKSLDESAFFSMGDSHSFELDLTSLPGLFKEQSKSPYGWGELGFDPKASPGKEFEWKGDGPPGSKQGNWVKGNKKDGTFESLRPDLDHAEPIGPHWDYKGPRAPNGARIFPDGTWELKR